MRSWWGHLFIWCTVPHKKTALFFFFFPSRHQSRPVRWTPPRLRGQQARAVISLSSGLIRWSSSVKCHSASIIRISLTRPSRLHAVNTRWALSQLWARAAAERPFVFFVLGWAAEGGGPVEKLHLTRSSLHKPRSQTKEDAWLPTGAKTDAEITSPHIGEAGKGHGDRLWNSSLCGFSLRHAPRWSVIYGCVRACCRRIRRHFCRNNVVLSDSLRLRVLSGFNVWWFAA